jgi:hypothetical protein
MKPELFAGPSLPHESVLHLATLHPPARRGDVDLLIQSHGAPRPGVIVLCDGVFQSVPAVSHAELCRALDAGWQVWGCSSMGAIRAWELRHEGMRGFGWVYAQFARHADFRDDEMALLHLPAPLYTPLTEALVNLRHALEVHGRRLGIPARAQRLLIEWLRECWFGERTQELIHDLLVGPLRVAPAAACALIDTMAAQPIKALDLQALLRARPWSRSSAVRSSVGQARPASRRSAP